ncbi:hypothetical protein BN59_02971 [Legionella massiliensis]|uniref:Uncharacterized protein n=1 Tax=Legionella massiliensis TaxID=1034943 RepID=A0A078L3F6_9GAMM|nr:hypothetical protein [Legionella massiliensis]CDZ78659.1 hypothetical protein BN59_02971 [Legionella massiliensis]CEE14397.1 hypothetical protein BN1094_02971 [Legionella massiliensis]
MSLKLWPMLTLILGLASYNLCYSYYVNGGNTVIIVNQPAGYYNGYPPYNYPYYNSYYPPNYGYGPYYYFPRYRCAVVPRCYPSGSCNYQNQECGYY